MPIGAKLTGSAKAFRKWRCCIHLQSVMKNAAVRCAESEVSVVVKFRNGKEGERGWLTVASSRRYANACSYGRFAAMISAVAICIPQ
jgi:hypothetical protein